MHPIDQTDWELISRYLGGTASETEIEQVKAWAALAPANTQLLEEMQQLWEQSAEAAVYGQIDLESEWARMQEQMNDGRKMQPTRKRYGNWWKWAAVFLLLAGSGWWAFRTTRPSAPVTEYNQITVSKGQRMQLQLSDGTRVWLNGNTELRYPTAFNNRTREVEITGAAYFDVAANADKPFIVKTPDYSVRVLGTEFRVLAYPGNPLSVTTLVKGAIQIENYDDAGNKQVLKAGHEAIFNRDNKSISIQPSDLTRNMQMKGEALSFNGITMKDLAQKLEVIYGIKIKLADDSLKNLKFTGKFYDDETIWKALDVIRLTTPVIYTYTGNEIFINWQQQATTPH